MELEGYSDLSLVGSGGNAHVYKAQADETGEHVAVKVLRGAGDEAVTRRFERERKLMGELSEIPQVVPILESGVTDGGDPYLVMPLYTGGSLQAMLAEEPVEWEQALELTQDVTEAVAAAHERRILHLDIKPANVLLDDDGVPWLGDFGIAEMMGSTASMSAAMMTPAYTPPERLQDSKPNERTDVYGLGAMLFALLNGAPPFGSEDKTNPAAVMMAVLNEPVPIDALPHRVPESVRNLLLRCMSKDPADRPESADRLVELLVIASDGGEITAPASGGRFDDDLTVAVGGTADDLTVARNPSIDMTEHAPESAAFVGTPGLPPEVEERSKKGLLFIAAAALMFIAGIGIAAATFLGGDDPTTEVASTGGTTTTTEAAVAADASSDEEPADDAPDDDDRSDDASTDGAEAADIETEVGDSGDQVDAGEESDVQAAAIQRDDAEDSSPAPTVVTTRAPTTTQPVTGDRDATTSTRATTTTKRTTTTTVKATTTTLVSSPNASVSSPNASFNMSATSVQEGNSVRFTDNSSGQVTSVSWRFSDGKSASGSSTTQTFDDPGTITVTMTATGPGGSDSTNRTLTVTAKPAADPPPRPDNEGCQYITETEVQWAFSPLPALVDTYVLEYSNGSRQDIGKQPGPFRTTDNALRKIIAVRDGLENALTVGSCGQHGGTKPAAGLPGLPVNVSCRFFNFIRNDQGGIVSWSETWNWSAGADTTSFIMVINQDGSILNVDNGASTTHTTVGVNGQSNSGRSVKGIIAVGPGGRNQLTIANCGAMGGTGWPAN